MDALRRILYRYCMVGGECFLNPEKYRAMYLINLALAETDTDDSRQKATFVQYKIIHIIFII